MMIDMEKERLEKIKLVNVHFLRKKCGCCENFFVHEKMWKVPRWGINMWKYNWYYCQNCTPTREDVLEEIDTDNNAFGIYRVDGFPCNPHKKRPIRFSQLSPAAGTPVLITDDYRTLKIDDE